MKGKGKVSGPCEVKQMKKFDEFLMTLREVCTWILYEYFCHEAVWWRSELNSESTHNRINLWLKRRAIFSSPPYAIDGKNCRPEVFSTSLPEGNKTAQIFNLDQVKSISMRVSLSFVVVVEKWQSLFWGYLSSLIWLWQNVCVHKKQRSESNEKVFPS